MTTKDEIFNYVMKTPENTNPAILKSLLDELNEGGGGGGGGATVTTFFDDTVIFSPVQTSFGTRYEAEVQLATLPMEFPVYDPDFLSTAYNHFLNCITPTNGGFKVIGQMIPNTDESLMCFYCSFSALPDSEGNCEVDLYSNGTLKFLAFDEWAQTPTRIQLQLVEI